LLQAPARSTQDHPPRDPTRGRRRTPPASAAKLRLTRRAWLLLWLTVAGLALVDGRLLLERSRILVAVEGRSASVPAGLTVEQALQRLAVPPLAGDLLAVDPQANQLAPAQPAVGGDQHQRPIPAADGVGHGGDLGDGGNRISGARSWPAPLTLTVQGLRSRQPASTAAPRMRDSSR
jgi:hypothetical protein